MPNEKYSIFETCKGCNKKVKFYRLLCNTQKIGRDVEVRKEIWSISKHMFDENKMCNRSNKRFTVKKVIDNGHP